MTVRVNATYTLKGWNAKQLRARVPLILNNYRPVLDKQFKDEIQAVQFPWTSRQTKRSTGEIAGSPRNIVDTGAFLRSQLADTASNINGQVTLLFTWGNDGVNYAGYILRGTTAAYPPRDWIRKALDNQPLEPFFKQEWRRLSRRSL